jgi:hypothetical protein
MLEFMSPKDLPLTRHERRISEPGGVIEEGVMEHLLSVVPPVTRYCIEFGARDGSRAHTRRLVEHHGFGACYIEGDPGAAARLQANFSARSDVAAISSFVTRENIEGLFASAGVPPEPWLLVIDIDGNDYHVWKAIEHYRPWFVCIEFNASYGPEADFVVDYRPDFIWRKDDYFGASIKPMVELGKAKGYALIHCTSGGDNLYFVRNDFFGRFGITDNSCEAMYQLPQYGRAGRARNGKGHPASERNTTDLQRLGFRLRYRLLAPLRRVVKWRMKRRHSS